MSYFHAYGQILKILRAYFHKKKKQMASFSYFKKAKKEDIVTSL
jgi:hypothetical protein